VLAHAAARRPSSLRSYVFFVCCPVLVYRFDFQRTARVRRGYVLQKIGLGCLLFAGLHNLSVFYIVPVMLSAPSLPMVVFVSRLLVPMTAFYVLLFFLVFECILNLSAEFTHFAERRFYDDWWNSTTFSEFARTWNRPVHEWLLAHIYSDALSRNLSKNAALLLTFLFSAVGHELVLMVLVKSWRPFLFPLQMSQVGLIMFEKRLKGTQLGNYLFHFGICVGIPLLSCLYAREYALNRLAMPLSNLL
jgi:sterol O-acyltransferase